jgi:Novel STAND NTPase 1
VHGDVAGRDIVHVTAEQTYDVSDLSANPDRGLAGFTYENRAFYGGRNQQISEALQLLTADGEQPSLVFVTGASGSGKSSFVQAGLLPALEGFYGERLRWAIARPGRHPMLAIARAIDALDGPVSVLVLDQFEELFTQAEAAEREQACAWLRALAPFARSSTQVILTLQSDYLPAIFNDTALFDQFKQHGIELRAMSSSELASAIRKPLLEQPRRDGQEKRLQAALVERLVDDVGTDATLLPLLQVTLTALWDEPPHTLTVERYRTLTDALEHQAEREYAWNKLGKERTAAEKQDLLGIFLDLVEVSLDDDPRRDVRRTVARRDLVRDRLEREQMILELVDARLLATTLDEQGRELVDIIRETLLRNWARLRDAIRDARDRLQTGARFRLAVREWVEHERSDGYLLEGVRLAEARALAAQRDIALSEAGAADLLATSSAREEQERQREMAQARALAEAEKARADQQQQLAEGQLKRAQESARAASRPRKWLVATALAALTALVAAGIAVAAFLQADRQARINASRGLDAQALAQLDTG